jgi:hypothetical protein
MRFLHGLEIDIRLGDVEKLSVKFDWIRRPNGFEQWQKFIGQSSSFCHVGAGCIHFVFVPAQAQTDAQPAVGKDVEGGQPASKHDGAVVGHVEHAGAQLDLFRLRGNVSERAERIEHLLVDFRKVSVRRARIGSLQFDWIQ